MLRRKLLIILGCLTLLMIGSAVVTLWSLSSMLGGLYHMSSEYGAVTVKACEVNERLTEAEVLLHRYRAGDTVALGQLSAQLATLQEKTEDLHDVHALHEDHVAPIFKRFRERLESLQARLAAVQQGREPQARDIHLVEAASLAAVMREDVHHLVEHANEHMEAEHDGLTSYFRWLIVGLAIGFLLVIDASVLILLRSAEMVLRPVDKLVEASKQLALERFDHRVDLDSHDEFSVLAAAYNRLAEQLQTNEQRRVELLQQAALTLNHELNNAMAIIDLELNLLGRRRQDPVASEKCLRGIHENLQRMARVVESLKHVRRIVLRDYLAGTKMLDLERSIEPSEIQIVVRGEQRSGHS